jgi:transcriptional regulator with XRE-family HTH domain
MALFEKVGDKDFDVLVAENGFVTDIQLAIECALSQRSISQAELAKLLDVSEARISQIMSGNGRNLQARTIARIAHVLGMKPLIEFIDSGNGWSVDYVDDFEVITPEGDWLKAAYISMEETRLNDNMWGNVLQVASDQLAAA